MSRPPVYLVDASIFLFRAWYSMPDGFENRLGEPTNAVYGFTGFLCNLLDQAESAHIGVVFDVSLESSHRNDIYPEYKANREPAPAALKRQFGWAREVAEAMGLRCFSDPRFEADDLIATLAEHWRERGHSITLVTGDKDLAQLVREGDHWWDFARNEKLGQAGVHRKFGVWPEQIADYLALMGDAVDNIPGIPGVGPKTAAALLAHFETLEALLARLPEVPHLSLRGAKSLHAKLVEHRARAELARRLTGLETRVPSALAAPELARLCIDTNRLNTVFDELAFGNLLRRRCLDAGN